MQSFQELVRLARAEAGDEAQREPVELVFFGERGCKHEGTLLVVRESPPISLGSESDIPARRIALCSFPNRRLPGARTYLSGRPAEQRNAHRPLGSLRALMAVESRFRGRVDRNEQRAIGKAGSEFLLSEPTPLDT